MIQFLVHEQADNVGVATVDIKSGETASGLYMDSQKKIKVKALQDIPLGHKIALSKFKKDDSVIKYGHDIGRVGVHSDARAAESAAAVGAAAYAVGNDIVFGRGAYAPGTPSLSNGSKPASSFATRSGCSRSQPVSATSTVMSALPVEIAQASSMPTSSR